jgi:hypothetical protein
LNFCQKQNFDIVHYLFHYFAEKAVWVAILQVHLIPHMSTKIDNTWTKMVTWHPFIPEYGSFRHVARERRRDDRPPTKINVMGDDKSGQCGETRNSLSLSSKKKWCGSRHLVFWSLGTLTGLRDRARGLVA